MKNEVELCSDLNYFEYANKTQRCAEQLEFLTMESGEKQVRDANFCHLRLCPMCNARRELRADYLMKKVMDKVCSVYGAKFIFLRFDFLRTDGYNLGKDIKKLVKAWNRFINYQRVKRFIPGWFRSIGIKKSRNKRWNGTYQLCVYAIFSVEPECFRHKRELYVEQLGQLWKRVVGFDDGRIVRIEKTCDAAVKFAACAVSKSDFLDSCLPEQECVKAVKDCTRALRWKRTTAYGGWMKSVAVELGAENLEDGDLIHIGEETVTEEIADYIETYCWHYGVEDYVLAKREVNPFKAKQEDVD